MNRAALLLVVFTLCLVCAVAERDGRSGKGAPSPRSANVDLKDNKLTIDMKKRGSEAAGSKLRFDFTTNGFPRQRLMYFRRGSDNDKASAKFTFRTGLLSIVEFNANSTYPAYQPGDGFSQIYRLAGASSLWSSIRRTTSVVGGVNVNSFTTVLSNAGRTKGGPQQGGRTNAKWAKMNVTIVLTIADSQLTINSSTFNPSALKMDVAINNWPWTVGATNAQLALVMMTGSTTVFGAPRRLTDAEAANADGENATFVGAGGEGFVAWVPKVRNVRNRTMADVHASRFVPAANAAVNAAKDGNGDDSGDDDDAGADAVQTVVAFTFADRTQSDALYWDPSIGANDATLDATYATSGAASASRYAQWAAAAVALVASVAAIGF